MTLKRFKPVAKLALLFGTPLAVVFGLFSAGVYCGVENRETIGAFERDWLGMAAPAGTGAAAHGPAAPAEGEKSPTDAAPTAIEKPAESSAPERSPASPPELPFPAPPAAKPDAPAEPMAEPLAGAAPSLSPAPVSTEPQPLAGPQAQLLGMPVVLSVKVLVDPRLLDEQPAWIDYVQRVVDETSQVFAKQFGIALELESVGRWRIGAAGMAPRELRADLETQPREGADLLLGLTAPPPPGSETEAWSAAPSEGAYNRAHGVVFAMPEASRPHLRPMLREISSMLGARGVEDTGAPEEHAGSWMSHSATAGTSFWIDAPNRARILERKVRPFKPETSPVSAPEAIERNVDGTED